MKRVALTCMSVTHSLNKNEKMEQQSDVRVTCRLTHMSLLTAVSVPMSLSLSLTHVRAFGTTTACLKKVAARYKVTLRKDKPLTYEMANAPHQIAGRKSWNSWNTSNLLDGIRRSETTTEDFFIRRFMAGTWHRLFLSEVIIKRRGNMIIIGGIVLQALHPRKMYFLTGYSEEILSYVLKCPIKLELQTVADRKDVVYKYV